MDLFHRNFPFERLYLAAHILSGDRLIDLKILMAVNADFGPMSLIGCISTGCLPTGYTCKKHAACRPASFCAEGSQILTACRVRELPNDGAATD
jgi:hypothetical protein